MRGLRRKAEQNCELNATDPIPETSVTEGGATPLMAHLPPRSWCTCHRSWQNGGKWTLVVVGGSMGSNSLVPELMPTAGGTPQKGRAFS